MSDFVWVIPSEQEASLGNGGISPSYIIPSGQMNGLSGRLSGSRLWIILRGAEDRCIAVASIKMVERFSEGYYAGDFLLSCDTSTSFRISSSFENAKLFCLSDFESAGVGAHIAPQNAIEKLKELLAGTVQVKFAAPKVVVRSSVDLEVFPKKGIGLAKGALSYITQTFTLDQLWASGIGDKLGPFCNFASGFLSIHGYDCPRAVKFLRENDPIYLLTMNLGRKEDLKPLRSLHTRGKSVDLDFTKIDPATIYARKFVPSEGFLPNLEAALKKTEASEKAHQDMLRDLSLYLNSIGIMPYESASIDLMFRCKGITRILEIKSSSAVNIVGQAAKGAFQLACYRNAMDTDYQPLDAALILHKIDDQELEGVVRRALDTLSIKHFTYDPMKEWPYRVLGLLEGAA